jgi:hypothetical protein
VSVPILNWFCKKWQWHMTLMSSAKYTKSLKKLNALSRGFFEFLCKWL